MSGVKVQGGSPSLRNQVTGLEKQLMLRRRRVRSLVAGANRKVAARLTSPGMLLAAAGVGVAVEQVSHHRVWSLATVIEATNACVGLLFTLTSFGQQIAESGRRPDA